MVQKFFRIKPPKMTLAVKFNSPHQLMERNHRLNLVLL